MRPINKKLLADILSDPYYKQRCLTGTFVGKIDLHHAWIYSRKQIDEKWNILPIVEKKHSPMGDPDSVHRSAKTDARVKLIALNRATKEDLAKYPKKNWMMEKIRLEFEIKNAKRSI